MAKVLGGAPALLTALLLLSPASRLLHGSELTQAEVTRIVKDVQLLPEREAPRPASVKDLIRGQTAVKTGIDSRTELTFTNQTLARLGANTIFSFNSGTRNLDLGAGAMLLYAPKGGGGAQISTAAVTAAITGTTVMIEYHPANEPTESQHASTNDEATSRMTVALMQLRRRSVPTQISSTYIKFITLEGLATIRLNHRPDKTILVPAGKMLIVAPDGSWYDVVDVDLAVLISTSLLISDFPPLASEPLIEDQIRIQQEILAGNRTGFSEDEPISLEDPSPLDTLDQRIAALPPIGIGGGGPGANEFGPLTTITSPNPYVVGVGTQIMTAPTITTAGVTSQGKIYRGQQIDGPASLYFFGATSVFDTASNFDAVGETGNPFVPAAAFKFSNLQLTGNPTVNIPPGGATNLSLISEGNITSGAPGGTLTFGGINNVLLATQNGSINLGSAISFANLNNLFLYARGVGSNITLSSPMMNIGSMRLNAEGSVQVNAAETTQEFDSFAGNFLTGTGVITVGVLLRLEAQNMINFPSNQFALAAGAQVNLIAPTVNIDASANPSVFLSTSSVLANGMTTLNITGGTTMLFGNLTQVDFEAGSGGIQASAMSFSHPASGLIMNAQGDINVNQILGGAFITSNGNIHAAASLSALRAVAGGDINVGVDLTTTQLTSATGPSSMITVGGSLTSLEVEVTGNVMADHLSVLLLNTNSPPPISSGAVTAEDDDSPNVITSSTVLTVGGGGITPYLAAPSNSVHRFVVSTVQSSNGINFDGNNFPMPSASGGTLILDAASQIIGVGGINGASFDGADAPMPGTSPAGGGGNLTVNAAGAIAVTGNIDATTGMIDTNGNPSGAGGSVNLTSSTGQVAVSGRIQVSSSDPIGTPGRQSSNSGGSIALQSDANTGVAIDVMNTGQLLALLENVAPGPGGFITILATGSNSSVNVSGQIEADGGGAAPHGVDIRHTGDVGAININGANVSADIVKIAALGMDGTLNIGGGMLSADSVLKLYAPGSNGHITFVADTTLHNTGANSIIAARYCYD